MSLQSLLWKSTETGTQNLGALHDVDKRMRIDQVQGRAQLDHVRAVKGNIDHLALLALIQSTARDAGATALDLVDDVIAYGVGIVGDDKHRLVTVISLNDINVEY